MGLPWDEGWSIPFDAPYYPPLPVVYRNVEFQYLFFEADPDAVARLLPEPLEPSPDGACMVMGIRVPFSSGYGAFNEMLIQQKCSFRGEVGWYCSHVWHDGPRGIAAGREIYGTPKILADLEVRNVPGGYLSRASMGGAPVLTISTTNDRPADVSELPATSPSWRLKMIPRADGPGRPALKQLIDTTPATIDFQVHLALAGQGRLEFHPSPFGDLTGLAPRSYGPAFYLETSYLEGFGRIALDYLVERP